MPEESNYPVPVLFGGTFDPFTPAHYWIVRNLTVNFKYHVYIVPTIVNYHRAGKTPWLPFDLRGECINWMLSEVHGWEIWNHEIKIYNTAGKSTIEDRRFIHTLDDFIREKSHEIGFRKPRVVLGTDSYNNLKTWHRWQEIVERSTLMVVPGRDNESLKEQSDVPFIKLNPLPQEIANISASKIRKSIGTSETDSYSDKLQQVRQYCTKYSELVREIELRQKQGLSLEAI